MLLKGICVFDVVMVLMKVVLFVMFFVMVRACFVDDDYMFIESLKGVVFVSWIVFVLFFVIVMVVSGLNVFLLNIVILGLVLLRIVGL